MKNIVTVYNPSILNELSTRYPEIWSSLKYRDKEGWIKRESAPTYNQLVKVSKAFNIPFGYLFLDNLPAKTPPIPYYRTLKDALPEMIEEVYDIITQVQYWQQWIKELLQDWGHERLPFAGKYTLLSQPMEIIQEIKSILHIQDGWAEVQTSWDHALQYLIDKYEEAGIFVAMSGIVGNNTRRTLHQGQIRGFVLYDDIAPFVFINGNDFLSAKIFTLIHELVHVLVGQSASFDLDYLESGNDDIEKFCNTCAAEFLVPTDLLNSAGTVDYDALARKFKVSAFVIARRLFDLGKISKEEYYRFYRDQQTKLANRTERKGGNFYNTIQQRYSKKALKILRQAVSNNDVSFRDFYRLLGVKPKTAETILHGI